MVVVENPTKTAKNKTAADPDKDISQSKTCVLLTLRSQWTHCICFSSSAKTVRLARNATSKSAVQVEYDSEYLLFSTPSSVLVDSDHREEDQLQQTSDDDKSAESIRCA